VPEKSSGQILGQLGGDFLPFGAASAPFVYSSLTAEVVEITVLGGLGAGFALTGAIVVGALAIPAAIMLAAGDNTDAGAIADAVHEVVGWISPSALGGFLVGVVVMPSDPGGFAKVAGYAGDLLTGGVFGPAGLDKLGALASAAAGFQGWKSDAISLGNTYLANQSGSSAAGADSAQSGAGQMSGSGTTGPTVGFPPASPSPSPSPSASSPLPWTLGSGDQGGFPFDFTAPGTADDSSSSSASYNFGPMNTLIINISDPGVSPYGSDNNAPPSDSSPGNPPASGDTGDSDESGSDDGIQNGDDNPPPAPPPAPPPSPGGGTGGDNGGGTDNGGVDDGGGCC
jgi:hypothetical protein